MEPIYEFSEAKGYELVREYTDEGISGTIERRKGLDQMLADAKRGHFKVLILMEISRLARDVRHLLNVLHELEATGVSVCSLREGIDFATPMGKAMVSMIGVLVQVERDLLAERIKTALAVKKQIAEKTGNGWRCGRPTKVDHQMENEIISMRKRNMSLRQIARRLGISKSSVLR